jgi:hypothetical protein
MRLEQPLLSLRNATGRRRIGTAVLLLGCLFFYLAYSSTPSTSLSDLKQNKSDERHVHQPSHTSSSSSDSSRIDRSSPSSSSITSHDGNSNVRRIQRTPSQFAHRHSDGDSDDGYECRYNSEDAEPSNEFDGEKTKYSILGVCTISKFNYTN